MDQKNLHQHRQPIIVGKGLESTVQPRVDPTDEFNLAAWLGIIEHQAKKVSDAPNYTTLNKLLVAAGAQLANAKRAFRENDESAAQEYLAQAAGMLVGAMAAFVPAPSYGLAGMVKLAEELAASHN